MDEYYCNSGSCGECCVSSQPTSFTGASISKNDFVCEVCGAKIDYAKHGILYVEELEITPKSQDDGTLARRFITLGTHVRCNKHYEGKRKYMLGDDDWNFAALMAIERMKRELEEAAPNG